jgi:hypothetical protein
LTTYGDDSRRLLCKAVLSLAQVRGRVLDGPGMVAWGRAAVAADPTYFSTHSQLSFGLQHAGLYAESLAEMKLAQASDGWEMLPIRARRIALLEQVVNGSKEEKKSALTELLKDKRGTAFRYRQEMKISRPAKSCALCFWDGDNKCARCKTVYYCSRDCQVNILQIMEGVCVYVQARATRDRQTCCSRLCTLKARFPRVFVDSFICCLSVLQQFRKPITPSTSMPVSRQRAR